MSAKNLALNSITHLTIGVTILRTFIHNITHWNEILFLTIRIGHQGCTVAVQSPVSILFWTTFFWLEKSEDSHKRFFRKENPINDGNN